MTQTWNVTFSKLPENLEELKALPMADLKNPHETAALVLCVLAQYPKNVEASLEMLNYLGGPRPLTPFDKQFLQDRFRGKDYIVNSFFAGSSIDNGYTPSQPYTVTIQETPHSKDQISEGYLSLFVQSSGADSLRQIKLRNKPSTGQWFLWEQFLLSDIRVPKELDPWA